MDRSEIKINYRPEGRTLVKPNIISCPKSPFLYILEEDNNLKAPLYVGETCGTTGGAIERIRRHFRSPSDRRNRLRRNLEAFGSAVPEKLTGHLYRLEAAFSDQVLRTSLEAWVVRLICHEYKMQHRNFAVLKYHAPSRNYRVLADKIVKAYLDA